MTTEPKKLRGAAANLDFKSDAHSWNGSRLLREAADEIERLQRQLADEKNTVVATLQCAATAAKVAEELDEKLAIARLAALQEAAKAVCEYCETGDVPKRWNPADYPSCDPAHDDFLWLRHDGEICEAHPIHQLIEGAKNG